MKKCIKRIISILLIITVSGCATTSTLRRGIIESGIENQRVYVTNFKAERSRGALFVSGTLVNQAGYVITNVEVEAKGYDKNNNLVSTDRIKIAPSQIKNNDKVNFVMTFVKNVDQIESYYFFGKYDFTSKGIKVDWGALKTLGTVVLVAGTVFAVGAAAYYSAKDSDVGGIPPPVGSTSPPTLTPIPPNAVYIPGYYRSDGTYVSPHYRSRPDQYIWNNFGPSQSDEELLNPYLRDYDKDGIPNYLDFDDDNDGINDQIDNHPYNPHYW